jgi:hypothetical protein
MLTRTLHSGSHGSERRRCHEYYRRGLATFRARHPECRLCPAFIDSSIDFAIWSHHHSNHTGDLSLFPTGTDLTYPGQLLSPNTETLHEAFEGRELNWTSAAARRP